MDRMTAAELQEGLAQFYGSDTIYKHGLSRLNYTQGVQFLAEQAGAYWLLDIIGSYQPTCAKDRMLADFQSWTLKVNEKDRTAVVICERDTDNEAFRQEIEWTDFPLPEIKLWVRNNVIMLPSEY